MDERPDAPGDSGSISPDWRLALSPAEVGLRLGIHRSSVYGLFEKGLLPSFHIGRRRLVSVYALEAFIRMNESQES